MRGDLGWEIDKQLLKTRTQERATHPNKGATIKLKAFAPCSRMAMLLSGLTAVRSRDKQRICHAKFGLPKISRCDETDARKGRNMNMPVWYHSDDHGGHALT